MCGEGARVSKFEEVYCYRADHVISSSANTHLILPPFGDVHTAILLHILQTVPVVHASTFWWLVTWSIFATYGHRSTPLLLSNNTPISSLNNHRYPSERDTWKNLEGTLTSSLTSVPQRMLYAPTWSSPEQTSCDHLRSTGLSYRCILSNPGSNQTSATAWVSRLQDFHFRFRNEKEASAGQNGFLRDYSLRQDELLDIAT